jgi:hypothetical protein
VAPKPQARSLSQKAAPRRRSRRRALENIPVKAQDASLPLPALQATPFAVLLGLVDLGHGASLQAETNAMAARLAREMSEGMTAAERIAVHQFLTKVADKVRWPQFAASRSWV